MLVISNQPRTMLLADLKSLSQLLPELYSTHAVLLLLLILEAHSFPQALLSENCSLLGTDNVHGQISEHIFAPNEDYCLFSGVVRVLQ